MKRILFFATVGLGAVALFAAGLGLGASGDFTQYLKASLSAGQEVPAPKVASRGNGVFKGTLSNRGRTLTWRISYSGLTGSVTAAHIHIGQAGTAGPVAAPLCGPCKSGAHGTMTVGAKLRSALTSGNAYVNLHTAKNPSGEIRGEVTGGTASGTSPAASTGTVTAGPASSSGGYG